MLCRSGPGFGYGFIMAWCFVLSFFCFLCGLVTSGFYPVVTAQLQTRKWIGSLCDCRSLAAREGVCRAPNGSTLQRRIGPRWTQGRTRAPRHVSSKG
jgi:hypothetical protein